MKQLQGTIHTKMFLGFLFVYLGLFNELAIRKNQGLFFTKQIYVLDNNLLFLEQIFLLQNMRLFFITSISFLKHVIDFKNRH